MRQQSKKIIEVKGKQIGGRIPLVCLPLVADNRADLIGQVRESVALGPDMLEWRLDGYGLVENVDNSLTTLRAICDAAGNIPLLATCRMYAEGGIKDISPGNRERILSVVAESGLVDIVDVEMRNGRGFVDKVKQAAQVGRAKIILSYHNFTQTPDEKFLVEKLMLGQKMGGDISKVAVMPKNPTDVLTLLEATTRARNGKVQIPIVTVSMGVKGKITRLAGGLFGSDITFAAGTESSAPGQIHIADLRQGMEVIY